MGKERRTGVGVGCGRAAFAGGPLPNRSRLRPENGESRTLCGARWPGLWPKCYLLENTTRGPSVFTIAGPMPLTRARRLSSDPNGPLASRSATIRAASAGPTRGRVSSSLADARSTSTGTGAAVMAVESSLAARRETGCAAPGAPVPPRDGRRAWAAESTASRWRARAFAAAGSGAPWCLTARVIRTTAPVKTTAVRKMSAVRSARVATPETLRACSSPPSPYWRDYHLFRAEAPAANLLLLLFRPDDGQRHPPDDLE